MRTCTVSHDNTDFIWKCQFFLYSDFQERDTEIPEQAMFHCKVCETGLMSFRTFGDHIRDRLHTKRVRMYDPEIVNYPEIKEVENLTALDVLKVADMTIKLVDVLKVRSSREEMDRYIIIRLLIESPQFFHCKISNLLIDVLQD